jgi:hypothetical protein
MKHLNLKRLLWISILFQILISTTLSIQCSKGCLKCLSSRECVICDIKNNYARISSTCIQNTLDHCQFRNFNGECLTCEKGYFLDFGKCTSAGTNVLDNCEVYFTATSCQLCSEEHYLTNGQCRRVGQVIQDCQVYNSEGTKCTTCKPGLILTLDLMKCDSIENTNPTANCLSYSQIGCKECKSGFMVNLNKVRL